MAVKQAETSGGNTDRLTRPGIEFVRRRFVRTNRRCFEMEWGLDSIFL